MLSIQHAMLLQSYKKNNTEREMAGVVYPDAIRAYSGRRELSHFEKSSDGKETSYMKFPSSMKTSEEAVKRLLNQPNVTYLSSNIKTAAIGEDTDINKFYDTNKHLDPTLHKAIEWHLKQDIEFDRFIRNEIDCSGKYEDKFVFNGKEMDGKETRALIGDIEQHGIYVLAHRLYEEQGITANQQWLQDEVAPALDSEYNSELAKKTFSFMNIKPEYNELITNHDWSKLNSGPLPREKYEVLYDKVLQSMSPTNRSFTYENKLTPSMPSFTTPVASSKQAVAEEKRSISVTSDNTMTYPEKESPSDGYEY